MTSSGAAALLLALLAAAAADASDWGSLSRFQRTITRAEFDGRLNGVYAPQGGATNCLSYASNSVALFSGGARTGAPVFTLEFAETNAPAPAAPAWTQLHFCLDPGHIGGAWARMEERFYFADRNDWYVQEAALNLFVARRLKALIEQSGARATLTKDDFEPVTSKRPADFEDAVRRQLGDYPHFTNLPDLFREASRLDSIRKRSEQAFFRASEIEARADRINGSIKPDVTICIHFNARDTENPHELIEDNGLAVFIHGNYLPRELEDPEQRFFMMQKLLEGSHGLELALADSVVGALRRRTGLPPAYHATGGPLFPAGTNDFLYLRNLAANREYRGPVVYLEPYFMNNRTTYARIQAGDYEGERDFDGIPRPSIFREYADAVFEGLTNYFSPR